MSKTTTEFDAEVFKALQAAWYEHPGVPCSWDVNDLISCNRSRLLGSLRRLCNQGLVWRIGMYTYVPLDGLYACYEKMEGGYRGCE